MVNDSPGLRPTPNRVRETLFNWLMSIIDGAVCLDLFSGTGVIAFEALSRGAASVVMIEEDPSLVNLINDNKQRLSATAANVINSEALNFLQRCETGFDLIFLDPPFNQGLVIKACDQIKQRSLLNTNGLIYIESENGLQLPEYLIPHKQKSSGQVQYGLYYLNV